MIYTNANNYCILEATPGKWLTNGHIYAPKIYILAEEFDYTDWEEVDSTPDDEILDDDEVINTIKNLL